MRFKKICLSLIHIIVGVWRNKFSSNDTTRDLLLNFVVKFKENVFENRLCQLNQIIGIFEEVCSSNWFFNANIPSFVVCLLEYRPTTSAVTRKEHSWTFPIIFILSKMHDQPLCSKGFKWKSRKPVTGLIMEIAVD